MLHLLFFCTATRKRLVDQKSRPPRMLCLHDTPVQILCRSCKEKFRGCSKFMALSASIKRKFKGLKTFLMTFQIRLDFALLNSFGVSVWSAFNCFSVL